MPFFPKSYTKCEPNLLRRNMNKIKKFKYSLRGYLNISNKTRPPKQDRSKTTWTQQNDEKIKYGVAENGYNDLKSNIPKEAKPLFFVNLDAIKNNNGIFRFQLIILKAYDACSKQSKC